MSPTETKDLLRYCRRESCVGTPAGARLLDGGGQMPPVRRGHEMTIRRTGLGLAVGRPARRLGGEVERPGRGGKAGSLRRAWDNLTPFGQIAATSMALLAASAAALFVGLLTQVEVGRATPVPLPPIVLNASIVTLTTPAPDLGRIVSMSVVETDGYRAVGSLSRAQVNALARDVSGSPYWAAWASKCWGGEATLVEGGRYLVATLSPTADYGLTAINEVWTAYGFEPERALRDPRYAVEFAWAEVMPRQGIAAWYGRGCSL